MGPSLRNNNAALNDSFSTLASTKCQMARMKQIFSARQYLRALFVEGTNVLAVEIHHSIATSPDVSFVWNCRQQTLPGAGNL